MGKLSGDALKNWILSCNKDNKGVFTCVKTEFDDLNDVIIGQRALFLLATQSLYKICTLIN